jgi:hypothetical protein
MYYSSSLADRARECLRSAAAETPIWRINPDKLARHNISLEGLPESDDPKEAEARYLNAFRSVHAEMLRDAIADAIDALPINVGDIAKHIQPCKLLWPDDDALEALGDAAGYFEDGFDGKDPDGDLLLAPADDFSEDELAAALEAGGEVVEGYKFYYPAAVVINRRSSRVIAPGKVAVGGWCAYFHALVGYALSREVATAVCAASIMLEAARNDAEKHIRPMRLLWIRRSDLIELGNAAGHFSDNGKKPDPAGDAWLAPANVFSLEELAAALRAGSELIDGYAFLYPRSVVVNRHLACVTVAGEVEDDRWCGYPALGIGYTLLRDVAEAVCAASIAQAKEEEVAEAIRAASIVIEAVRNDAEKHIRPIQLLSMPRSDLLEELGNAAGRFSNNGKKPDGNLLLAPANVFSSEELAAALAAGGELIDGYEFDYPRGVAINRYMRCIAVAGEVADDRWCGYPALGIGYAVQREVAEAVCAASLARVKRVKKEE